MSKIKDYYHCDDCHGIHDPKKSCEDHKTEQERFSPSAETFTPYNGDTNNDQF